MYNLQPMELFSTGGKMSKSIWIMIYRKGRNVSNFSGYISISTPPYSTNK